VLRPDGQLDFVLDSAGLLVKLPSQQPTFQCPDFEDAVLRAVTAVFGRHINHRGVRRYREGTVHEDEEGLGIG
jgi:hypothetical protein